MVSGLKRVKSAKYVPNPDPNKKPHNSLALSCEIAAKAVWKPIEKGSSNGFCTKTNWYNVIQRPSKMIIDAIPNPISFSLIPLTSRISGKAKYPAMGRKNAKYMA